MLPWLSTMFEDGRPSKRSFQNGDSDSESKKKQKKGKNTGAAQKALEYSGQSIAKRETMSEGGRSPRSEDGSRGGRRGAGRSNDQDLIHVKLLIPSVSAGPLIGKGGETIAQIQRERGVSMKLSKANDYYPGTSERVCLIAGENMDSILSVVDFIMDKIGDSLANKGGDSDMVDRENQVKIVVPNSTAGMIIGKSGSYIKQVTDQSGARVQISQRAKDQQEITPERCMTITGDKEQLQKACQLVVEKIANDPQSNAYVNVSYAHVTHPVANANPQGSPYAFGGNGPGNASPGGGGGMQMGSMGNSMGMRGNMNSGNDLPPNPSLAQLLNNIIPPGQVQSAMTSGNFLQLVDSLNLVLRNIGLPDNSILEICNAVRTLANYRILGWSFAQGTSDNTTSLQSVLNALSNSSFGQDVPMSGQGNQSLFSGGASSSNTANWSGDGMMNSSGGFPMQASQGNSNTGNEYNIQTSGGGNEEAKFELPVNENIVGSIIGYQGKTLMDIQGMTGTKIQISKKGEYAPGTRDRIVTVTGPGSSVIAARGMIWQRIQQEKLKRQHTGGAGDAHNS